MVEKDRKTTDPCFVYLDVLDQFRLTGPWCDVLSLGSESLKAATAFLCLYAWRRTFLTTLQKVISFIYCCTYIIMLFLSDDVSGAKGKISF